jgi:hypothetical protein
MSDARDREIENDGIFGRDAARGDLSLLNGRVMDDL